MFNNKESKANITESGSVNLISQGTSIKGDIHSNGDIRIDGQLEGSVVTKGKVVVGTTGVISGEITCTNADISGTVHARVVVSELLSLKSTAKLSGDISTNKLAIEPGANYTGNCTMGGIVKDLNKHNQQEKAQVREKTA
ncbi:MAG: polymer-forming cytoskeletal protein [Flavobacteriales bacterium]